MMSRYQCPGQHAAREKKLASADDPKALRRIAVSRLHTFPALELWRGDHRIGREFDEDGVGLELRLRVARAG